MPIDWKTVGQVAEWLQVSEETVRRWLRNEQLKGHNLGGNIGWRIDPDDVDAFVKSRPSGKEHADD